MSIRIKPSSSSGYTQNKTDEGFRRTPMLQDAVGHNIEIIGEAARNIETFAPDFISQHGDIPWTALYRMRNRLALGYWAVDLDVV